MHILPRVEEPSSRNCYVFNLVAVKREPELEVDGGRPSVGLGQHRVLPNPTLVDPRLVGQVQVGEELETVHDEF